MRLGREVDGDAEKAQQAVFEIDEDVKEPDAQEHIEVEQIA